MNRRYRCMLQWEWWEWKVQHTCSTHKFHNFSKRPGRILFTQLYIGEYLKTSWWKVISSPRRSCKRRVSLSAANTCHLLDLPYLPVHYEVKARTNVWSSPVLTWYWIVLAMIPKPNLMRRYAVHMYRALHQTTKVPLIVCAMTLSGIEQSAWYQDCG